MEPGNIGQDYPQGLSKACRFRYPQFALGRWWVHVNRPLFDDPGSEVPDYATLRVDIAALGDLATALRQEIDKNLLPHVGPLAGAYGMGVKFGLMSHSQNMKLARKMFHDCLVNATESLANRIAVGESLAAAVEQVAKLYGGSDAMASARSEG